MFFILDFIYEIQQANCKAGRSKDYAVRMDLLFKDVHIDLSISSISRLRLHRLKLDIG